MNTQMVGEAARATLAGTMPFPEIVGNLIGAGVQAYIAFLRGKRVTDWGRGGDQHTEWFPGAAPTGSR